MEKSALKLAEAVQGLRRMKMLDFDQIAMELQFARYSCQAALILREIDPGKAPYIYSKAALIESWYDGIPDLFSLALEKINDQCPLDTNQIEEQLLNYEGVLNLTPESLGFPYSFDELNELLYYPDDLQDEMAFEWFVIALGGNLGYEQLETLVERYPIWNVSLEDLPGDDVLDWPKFEKTLKRNGLAEFSLAIRVIWKDTGSLYLDFDPYGEDILDFDLPDFGLEGVRRLVAEYQAALPYIRALSEAEERIQSDPTIYRKIARIMRRCLKDTKQQAQTLLEVFTRAA